jgi:hypothetical protein
MAMLDPTERKEDHAAGKISLWIIGGLSALLVVLMVLVIVYYNGISP